MYSFFTCIPLFSCKVLKTSILLSKTMINMICLIISKINWKEKLGIIVLKVESIPHRQYVKNGRVSLFLYKGIVTIFYEHKFIMQSLKWRCYGNERSMLNWVSLNLFNFFKSLNFIITKSCFKSWEWIPEIGTGTGGSGSKIFRTGTTSSNILGIVGSGFGSFKFRRIPAFAHP